MLARSTLTRSFSRLTKYPIVILGGGAGGVSLAASLIRTKKISPRDIAIIDHSKVHHYKPGWPLYITSHMDKSSIEQSMSSSIPEGVNLIQSRVEGIDGDRVITAQGEIEYGQLVVALGVESDFSFAEGLDDAIRAGRVCSVMDSYERVKSSAKEFKKGRAVFAEGKGPLSCPGASLSLLFLLKEQWPSTVSTTFIHPNPLPHPIPFYASQILTELDAQGVTHKPNHLLKKITSNTAVYEDQVTGKELSMDYDWMHVMPSQQGPSNLRKSGLVDNRGFVMVDKGSLKSRIKDNVWAIGDCCDAPTSKTMSGAIEQSQILTTNLLHAMSLSQQPSATYDGYTGCPVLVGGKAAILAEYKYEGIIAPTLFKDQRSPSRIVYFMKKYLFPFAGMTLLKRGLWKGRKSLYDPSDKDYREFQKREDDLLTKYKDQMW